MRNAIEAFQRVNDAGTMERVHARLPKRLAPLLAPGRLRSASTLDTLPLADAEDVLFAVDTVVGHGAGSSMELIAEQIVARAITDGSVSLGAADLASTISRLRPLFVSAFVDVAVTFELSRTPLGFTLLLGVEGRPRAARLLRHYAIGIVRAVAQLTRDPLDPEVRISDESIADTALITANRAETPSTPPSRSRVKAVSGRPSPGSLQTEVERILAGGRRTPLPAEARASRPPPKAAR